MKYTKNHTTQRWFNRQAVRHVYDWVGALIIALIVLVLLFSLIFRVVEVSGNSMQPTLYNGDRLALSAVNFAYVPGDIVVIDRYVKEPLVKRVVALEGDEVEITDTGILYINGVQQYEAYIQGDIVQNDMVESVTVPEGYVLVLGDNRADSLDSREDEVGLIPMEDLVGKVVFRIAPFSSFGSVYRNLENNLG